MRLLLATFWSTPPLGLGFKILYGLVSNSGGSQHCPFPPSQKKSIVSFPPFFFCFWEAVTWTFMKPIYLELGTSSSKKARAWSQSLFILENAMLHKSLLKGKRERNKKSFWKKSNFQSTYGEKFFKRKTPQSGAYHIFLSIIFAYGHFVE